jgi:heat shock protein HslJ
MNRIAIIGAATLLLAGCGDPQDKLSDEEASVQQTPAVLDNGNAESETITAASDLPAPEDAGDILYKAVGTEPGWSLTVRPARMDYSGDYGQANLAEPTPPDFRANQGTYRSGKLIVKISAGPCSDGMSDLTYRQTVQVIADGRTVSGCGGGTIAANALAGSSWTVVAVNGRPAPAADNYYVRFSDRQVSARFGCNAMGGDYRINGDHLTVGNLVGTQMGCPEPAMSLERDGAAALRGNIRVEKAGDNGLRLVSEAGTIDLKKSG